MQSAETGAANRRRTPPSVQTGRGSELDALRVTCGRQAVVIDRLSEVVSNLHRGAKALKAENIELRAENDRMRLGRTRSAGAAGLVDGGDPIEVLLPLDAHSPGVARRAVGRYLRERAATSVLDNAQLLVSELVTNSVRHSGAATDDELVVRMSLAREAFRLEVEDSGQDGFVAPRSTDPVTGGGIGLNLVQTLSERWGVERVLEGGTRVWAQLLRAPGGGASRSAANGSRPVAAPTA
jgi:anti-sigma regulatory factor (Ser/Thr protein kinase)